MLLKYSRQCVLHSCARKHRSLALPKRWQCLRFSKFGSTGGEGGGRWGGGPDLSEQEADKLLRLEKEDATSKETTPPDDSNRIYSTEVEEAGEEREAATSDHKGAVPILPYDLGRDPFADPFVRNHSASILDELQFKVLWRDAHPVCVCPRSNRMQANLIFEAQPKPGEARQKPAEEKFGACAHAVQVDGLDAPPVDFQDPIADVSAEPVPLAIPVSKAMLKASGD
eukprot:1145328-Pelagomonas_calceolata.AAC.4